MSANHKNTAHIERAILAGFKITVPGWRNELRRLTMELHGLTLVFKNERTPPALKESLLHEIHAKMEGLVHLAKELTALSQDEKITLLNTITTWANTVKTLESQALTSRQQALEKQLETQVKQFSKQNRLEDKENILLEMKKNLQQLHQIFDVHRQRLHSAETPAVKIKELTSLKNLRTSYNAWVQKILTLTQKADMQRLEEQVSTGYKFKA